MTNENGEVFFVGKDVALALGYKNPSNALQVHVNDEDKTSYLIQVSGSRYKANTLMINESGLYSLVLSSKFAEPRQLKAARHPAQLSGEQHRESGKNNQHCAVQRVG